MKKYIVSIISAALVAMPLAFVSTTANASYFKKDSYSKSKNSYSKPSKSNYSKKSK